MINYDFPNSVEDFVHRYCSRVIKFNLFFRIGRTARGSSTEGNSYTFFTSGKADRSCAAELVELMKDADQEIPQALLDLSYSSQKGGSGSRWGGNGRGGGRFGGGGRGGGRGGQKRW